MATNPYMDLTTLQLADVYFTTMANYKKIDGPLLEEIIYRGGEEVFLKQVERAELVETDKSRVKKEMLQLMTDDEDPSILKKLIHSDVMTETELSAFIDNIHPKLLAENRNRRVDTKTILIVCFATIVAALVAGFVCVAFILMSDRFYNYSIVLLYGISWLVIWLITKKNAANAAVFIGSMIATVLSIVFAFLFLQLNFNLIHF